MLTEACQSRFPKVCAFAVACSQWATAPAQAQGVDPSDIVARVELVNHGCPVIVPGGLKAGRARMWMYGGLAVGAVGVAWLLFR